jgi:hypothetical protein
MYLPYSHTMKLVYELRVVLRDDPERIGPSPGLKETPGLLGSEEWWESTRNGRLHREDVSGVIMQTYFAGQDSRWGDEVNSMVVRADDGSEVDSGIYLIDRSDMRLFKPGHRVAWAAVRAPLKLGGTSKVVLEMAVSLKPEA